jgi:hypothetical protein
MIRNRFSKGSINANFASSKPDKENHGLGINKIKRKVKKYNGDLETIIQKDIFIVRAILYIES